MKAKKRYKLVKRFIPFYRQGKELNEYEIIKEFDTVKEGIDFWREYKKENGEFFGLKGYEGYALYNEKEKIIKLFRTCRTKYKPA